MKLVNIILCFFISVTLRAQCDILDLERYNALSTVIYIDNLPQDILCLAFQDYYSSIPACKYDSIQIISQESNLKEVFVTSPKARKGFLYVNRVVNDMFNTDPCPKIIRYIYNNTSITSKKDVMQIVKLRKKNIKALNVSHDEQSNEIIVHIYTDGKKM